MRELLGGKGANVAEMTRLLGAERVPAGLHDHDRGLRGLHGGRTHDPEGSRAGRRRAGAARGPRRQGASAIPRTRCSSRCAPVPGSRCPGCSTPCSTSGSTRSPSRGSRAAHRQRALCLGLLPALRADVRQRRARHARRGASSRRSPRSRRSAACKLDTELDVEDLRKLTAASSVIPGAHGRAVSRRTAGPARQAIHAVFDSWLGERAVHTGGSTAFPTSGAPPSTSSRWCSATRARAPARALPSAATRSPVRPSPPAIF